MTREPFRLRSRNGRRCLLFAASVVLATAAGSLAVAPTSTASPSTTTRVAYVTLLFSRTELTAADNDATCTPIDAHIARTDTVVAPYLAKLGITPTGSVQTGPIGDTTGGCPHLNESVSASWNDLTALSTNYGWHFVSHSRSYPSVARWNAMTPGQVYAETCGSAAAITRHGLSGANGLFAWPDNHIVASVLPTVKECFDASRIYGPPVTSQLEVTSPPYEVSMRGLTGGACNDSTRSCYEGGTPPHYYAPSYLIRRINNLQPGKWLNMQAYLLVRGKNPSYATNPTRWNCRSSDPLRHHSNDAERYCYKDFRAIMKALAARVASGAIVVTDPATVMAAFGRTVVPPGTS